RIVHSLPEREWPESCKADLLFSYGKLNRLYTFVHQVHMINRHLILFTVNRSDVNKMMFWQDKRRTDRPEDTVIYRCNFSHLHCFDGRVYNSTAERLIICCGTRRR